MNLVLLSLDTTRADHLGCYGYSRCTSPTLDRLAEGGTLFERCFSPHIPTHPAHTGLFTGEDIYRHRVVAQGASSEPPPDLPLLAERLATAGYWTGAADNLGRWFSRGFHRYEGYTWTPDPSGSWRKGEAVARTACALLREAAAQERPFFLFAHFWDAHTPYRPPSPFHRLFHHTDERDPRWKGTDRSLEPALNFPPFQDYFRPWLGEITDIRYPIAEYDAALAYQDYCVQHLVQCLDDLGLGERTLLAVTADHGEELDEHAMWFDHHGLYDTNLHVPLLLSQPGTVPAGRRVRGIVRLFDLAPTLLDAAGLPHLATGMQGRSLLPLLTGDADRGTTDRIYATECTWMRKRALRTADWKLIVARDHPDLHGCPPVELYDLRSDPGERTNLAGERPEVVAVLSGELDAWRERRCRETGLPDPIEEQPITLTRIGVPAGADPRKERAAS